MCSVTQSCMIICDLVNCRLQIPLSMGLSRQEYWSELPFPHPRDLLNPGIKPTSSVSPTLAGRFFTTKPPGNPSDSPCFLQFQPEFCNKEFMIWATVSSWSWFCWLYRACPSLAAKNIISLISVLTIWWCPCVESSLVLLEEGVFYDQCVLLAKLY